MNKRLQMKTPALTITTAFLLFSASALAQAGEHSNTEPQPTVSPLVTKGYYAIGKHSGKLASVKESRPAARTTSPAVQKGYYGIVDRRRKAPALPPGNYLGAKQPRHYVRPEVSKGYYAIGNNAEKL